MDNSYDVVVVGGGAAGLSGALALSRARRSVLVVDAGEPRNAPAGHVHNYLAREGTPPRDLMAAGRAEVASYGGEVVTGRVDTVELLTGAVELLTGTARFRVRLDDGEAVLARRLLVTTGLTDELPDLPGLAQRFGRDVLHCPYCHGWEVRDRLIGVLATGPPAMHQTMLFRQLSPTVTLFQHTGPALTDAEREELAARDVRLVEGDVAGLEVVDDQLVGVRLRSGEVVECQALVVAPRFVARAGLLASLGLEPVELKVGDYVLGESVPADPTGATAVPGVWVAGNVTDLRAQVITSAAAGLNAGAAINADLVAEDTRDAVAAYRRRAASRTHASRTHIGHTHADHTHADRAPADRGAAERLSAEQYWEDRYQEPHRHWSGKANLVLVDVAGGLRPGAALDLGCGDGSDAIWLAAQGWRVTSVDISATALARAAERAEAAGVTDVDWQRHDLTRTFPEGSFDLVSAQFLHSMVEFPRDDVLRAAAGTVAPGGTLLIVGHLTMPPWGNVHDHAVPGHEIPDVEELFPTPERVIKALDLPVEQWRTVRADVAERQVTAPDGQTATISDSVVALTRILPPPALRP